MTKEQAIDKINKTPFIYLNDDQKKVAIGIINSIPTGEDVLNYFDFIMKRADVGFKFDVAPEIATGRIAVISEMKDLNINVNDKIDINENKLIIGDNYEALKNLLLTHKEKIDMIYIDPPYNTEKSKEDGNTSAKEGASSKFIYKDKFGRNGWLNMMRDRLILARRLLSSNGVIFVSIDDTEQAYLKILMDDIFGEDNFIANLNPLDNLKGKSNDKFISMTSHYIITYARNKKVLNSFNEVVDESTKFEYKYNKKDELGNRYSLMSFKKTGADKEREKRKNSWFPILLKNNNIFSITNKEYIKLLKKNEFDDSFAKILEKKYITEGYSVIWPLSKTKQKLRWTSNFTSFKKLLTSGELEINANNSISLKNRPSQKEIRESLIFGKLKNNFYKKEFSLGTHQLKELGLKFSNPKSTFLLKFLINLIQNDNDILILDFFAGSGTTGQAVLEFNKKNNTNNKFILVTNNENNIAINTTYERIYRIINGHSSENKYNFNWINKNSPFTNEKLRVFNIKHFNVETNQSDELENITKFAIKNLNKLNPLYKPDNIQTFYDLDGLNPLNEAQANQIYSTDKIVHEKSKKLINHKNYCTCGKSFEKEIEFKKHIGGLNEL